MRIGVIHWTFPPIIGGVEMHLYTILPEMVKQGAEVFVLTASVEGAKDSEIINGVKVKRCQEMGFSNLRQWAKEGKDIYSLTKDRFADFLAANSIEAVMAHNLHIEHFELSRALSDSCRKRNIPMALVIHNHRFPGLDEEEMWRIVEVGWDRLVPISRFIERSMQTARPSVPKERYTTILHGIDIEKFGPATGEEREGLRGRYGFNDRKIVLHPARMGGFMKGVVQAIKAMAKVKERFPESVLVFTGRAKPMTMSERENREVQQHNEFIDSFIEKLGLKENIHIGDYSYPDIPKLTQICDCLVYPTIVDEAFGLCPVEGMACGVPVVVTRSGGMVESVVDGVTGFIVERDKHTVSNQLAEGIIKIFSDPAMASKMGQEGRKRAEAIFDKSRMAKDFINLCQEMVERRKEGKG